MQEAFANLTAAFHLLYFVVVVAGFVCIVGGTKHYPWTRNLWLRIGHALLITIVLVENTVGLACPLNVLEWRLRATPTASSTAAKEAPTGLGFVLDQLLFHTIGGNVLNGLWWTFGALALALFVLVPPQLSAHMSGRVASKARR